MDTDFVNKYIQKQSQLINELTSKNLMVEVKFQILEEQYAHLLAQHQALVESVERARVSAEEQRAAELEAQKAKPQKKHASSNKQPSELSFAEEEQQLESQF